MCRKRAKTEDEKELRRIQRANRNREAAKASRDRKRLEFEALEAEKMELQLENQLLRERLGTAGIRGFGSASPSDSNSESPESEEHSTSENHKDSVRERVWASLGKVARPDSRFHFDFSEFIADFEGSSAAIERFVELPQYLSADIIFITPDNCLEELRMASLKAVKAVLTTTYGIRRGFWLLDPTTIPPERYEYACTLDGMEKLARPMSLKQIMKEKLKVDLMVTGTGAINRKGIRFGKGHGFFDLEWAMLHSIAAISHDTPAAAVVHDCQLLDEELLPETFDTVCDIVVTPEQVISVSDIKKPTCGILWERLAEGMFEDIPPLRELKKLLDSGFLDQRP